MRTFSFRRLIPLAAVFCFGVWHGVACDRALARRRVPTSSPPVSPSQRWLPVPQGPLASPRQQVQWLQQLKDGLGAESRSPTLPPFDPEQLKRLQETMQQMAGGRSNVPPLPKLDGLSPEQMSQALSDPALREQVRKLLEQFRTQGQPTRNGTAPDSPSGANPEALPRELQELMQQMTDQPSHLPSNPAQSRLTSKRDSAETASTEREPGGRSRSRKTIAEQRTDRTSRKTGSPT